MARVKRVKSTFELLLNECMTCYFYYEQSVNAHTASQNLEKSFYFLQEAMNVLSETKKNLFEVPDGKVS